MAAPREATRVGLAALAEATTLLQRIRRAHPTAGLYEAADLQWAWRRPGRTDALPQPFWSGEDGRAEAALVATEEGEEGEGLALVPIVGPGASVDVAEVVGRGLAHLAGAGLADEVLTVEVARDDAVLHDVLAGHGFAVAGDGVVETWLATADRPPVGPLARGYRLSSRADSPDGPHPMTHAGRNHPDVEARLRQTSLYRPDLDLAVHDEQGAVAAYGLFWLDPATATGLVEPLRTEDAHQRRGLARHVLTAGVDRLAAAGAERVKICFEPGNPAARDLYLDLGFRPDRETVVLRRR